MNLFEFFHAAAYRFLGRNVLTWEEQTELVRRMQVLNRGFGGTTRIDYSDPLTRLAYMFSYAPKHAIIWREYMRQRTTTGSFCLNSLGTACGPEIIGILEGIDWRNPGTATIFCVDTEPGWVPMLNAVADEYRSRRGNVLVCRNGTLMRGIYLVGSMILSEVVKQGAHRTFRTTMSQQIGPAEGLFLDITNCRMQDGSEPFLSDIFGFGYWNFSKNAFRVRDVINTEMKACTPCYCANPLRAEPKMNFFFAKFR